MAEILPKINKFKADFMFGAIYEFVLNEVESAQVTGALMWNFFSAVTGDSIGSVPVGSVDDWIEGYLEEKLPQTAAFYMGRLTGSGAGMVAALYKFKAGLPLLGIGLQGIQISALAGVATRNEKVALVGSALSAALSGAVVTNSAASAVGALDGALENTATLMAMMSSDEGTSGLDVVPRKGMDERVVVDVDGEDVTIYGQNNSSSKTDGHDDTIERLAEDLASSGEYEYVLMQRSWRTATGRVNRSRKIPDVIGVRRDGKVDAWEVQSETDDFNELVNRLDLGRNSLPSERRGTIEVIQPD